METAWTWISQHGFDLLSSVGIVAGLIFTGVNFQTDTRSRRLATLITLTQQHRDIWEETLSKPHLNRVIDPDANVVGQPVSKEESQFVVLLFLHLHCWFRAVQSGELRDSDSLTRDIRQFFILPIPRSVWFKKRTFYDRDFVKFVEIAADIVE